MNKKAKRKEKRQKKELARMKRLSRFRPLKNFAWWLTGVLTPVILLVVVIAVGVFLIPISTYVKWAGGENTSEYVSDEIANKSIFGSIQGIADYTMNDIPAIKMLVDGLSNKLSSLSINNSSVIKVDTEKLETLKDYKIVGDFSGFFAQYTSCLSVVATIGGIGVDLGEMGQLPAVNTFEEVQSDEKLTAHLTENAPLETPQLYYYDANQLPTDLGGVTPQSDGGDGDSGVQPTEGNYQRAFKNDGSLVEELSSLTTEQLGELKFYYPALNSVPMVDFPAVFGPRFKMTKINSILEVFSSGESDGILSRIAGEETIETVGSLDTEDIKLVDVIEPPSDYEPEIGSENYDAELEAYNKNRDIYNILKDATGKSTYEEITLADLSNMDTDKVLLVHVLDAPTSDDASVQMPEVGSDNYEAEMKAYNAYHQNRKLYDILMDASNKTVESCEDYKELTVKDLNNFNVNNIKLSHVMEESSNKIIQTLLEQDKEDDPVTLGTIGDKINALPVKDVYDVECFTTNKDEAVIDATPYYKTVENNQTVYTTTEEGEEVYYISKTSNIWLFMLFDSSEVDANSGVANKYAEQDITVEALQDRIEGISGNIINATVRQIYECGMIDESYENINNLTIIGVIERLDDLIPQQGQTP